MEDSSKDSEPQRGSKFTHKSLGNFHSGRDFHDMPLFEEYWILYVLKTIIFLLLYFGMYLYDYKLQIASTR